jgi:hypothetical protein
VFLDFIGWALLSKIEYMFFQMEKLEANYEAIFEVVRAFSVLKTDKNVKQLI